jgi:uncharacterized membrane protein
MALGQLALKRGWLKVGAGMSRWAAPGPYKGLALVGRWSLSWYMLHQPILIGLLALSRMV